MMELLWLTWAAMENELEEEEEVEE